MYGENEKLAKFSLLVEKINGRIGTWYSEYADDRGVIRGVNISRNTYKSITPLNLVFSYDNLNEYGKIVLDTVYMEIEDGKWNVKYAIEDLEDKNKKMIIVKEFVRYYQNKVGKYTFIFWAIIIAIIQEKDFSDNMSLISDFAYLFEMTKEDIEDVVIFVKIALGNCSESEVNLKNNKTYLRVICSKIMEIVNIGCFVHCDGDGKLILHRRN